MFVFFSVKLLRHQTNYSLQFSVEKMIISTENEKVTSVSYQSITELYVIIYKLYNLVLVLNDKLKCIDNNKKNILIIIYR
jgi:hypothetical protein